MQSIANLSRGNATTLECLRVVIETLIQGESAHQVSTRTRLPDATCEILGDVLEAAGGLLSPYTPAAKPFMISMHAAHKIGPRDDADAFRNLQLLAQCVKDLSNMVPAPKSRDGRPGDNSAHIWAILNEIRPDNLVLEQRLHSITKGCWICNELRELGGDSLLNPPRDSGEGETAPILREGRGRRRKQGGRLPKQPERDRSQIKRVVLKARRAIDRGRSRAQSLNRIVIRVPPIITDTRLHDTQRRHVHLR